MGAVVVLCVAASATALLLLGSAWRSAPVHALGGSPLGSTARLRLPAPYVVLSPICEVYDALTMLGLDQHAALLGWAVTLFVMVRTLFAVRSMRGPRAERRLSRRMLRGIRRELGLLILFVVAILAFYAAGAIIPRPMAALALTDRDELAVDVHSHTSFSHDGRLGFDAAANRRWHAAAGFAAAYITDHRFYDGAVDGARGNPRLAGEGTVLLPGIESAVLHSRLTLLGARAGMGLDVAGKVDTARLSRTPGVVVVLTTPASLARIPETLRLDAVESSDGAPRGLMFTRRMAPAIGRFAEMRGLALVAGSNYHGWGRTASAWTVLRLPGWRMMSPDSLDSAIRATLLHPSGAVRVIARMSTPMAHSTSGLVATPLRLAWSVVTQLSRGERIAWICWIWGAVLFVMWRRRRYRIDADDEGTLPFVRALPNGKRARRTGRVRVASGRAGER